MDGVEQEGRGVEWRGREIEGDRLGVKGGLSDAGRSMTGSELGIIVAS